MNQNIGDLLKMAGEGGRLDRDGASALFTLLTPESLYRIGEAANSKRLSRYGLHTTYINNLQINPSNICVRACTFCDFATLPGRPGGYSLMEKDIFAMVSKVAPSEVHIVGGLNHDWDFNRSLSLIRELHRTFPEIYIKCFTAVEIHWFASNEKKSIEEILVAFREAGMDALPGGGAEMFSERIRQRDFRQKLDAAGWLAVHEAAHKLGIPTNATMLYGLGETWEERLTHLFLLRNLQDCSGGFVSFIPLALQPGNGSEKQLSPLESLMVIAMCRLVLDNIPHIKAYWPMLGIETAMMALSFGADDLDGTLGLERIAHAAGAKTPKQMSKDEMIKAIRLAGYEAVERDGTYQSGSELACA